MSDTIATWINGAIESRGWSLREVARRVGVSHTTIVKLANGQAQPSPALCRDLARVFGVSYIDLLRMTGIVPEIKTGEGGDREVVYLAERLAVMEPEARQRALALLNSVLDYGAQQAPDAQKPAGKNGRRRKRVESGATDEPGDRRRQLLLLWDALSDEEREELGQALFPDAAGGVESRPSDQ